MYLTHKIALNPSKKQLDYFKSACGTHRKIYNDALVLWETSYKLGNRPTGMQLVKEFNKTKYTKYPWLNTLHRDCSSQPFRDLQKAFTSFLSGKTRYPTFKKKGQRDSFYLANCVFWFKDNLVKMPKVGKVKLEQALRFEGKIMSARVVREIDKWFICVSIELPEHKKPRTSDGIVGVDLGLKALAVTSNGEIFDNPKPLAKYKKKLAKQQRWLARKVKGSKNRKKQIVKVAKIHQKIKNIRNDNLHKITTQLCRENQTIVIEELKVKNMVKNHKLAGALSDASFGTFRTMLTYKSEIYGNKIIVADQFFPSSKMCSNCKSVKEMLSLKERTYKCTVCLISLDRDLNAAINLRNIGQDLPEYTPMEIGAVRPVVEVGINQIGNNLLGELK